MFLPAWIVSGHSDAPLKSTKSENLKKTTSVDLECIQRVKTHDAVRSASRVSAATVESLPAL